MKIIRSLLLIIVVLVVILFFAFDSIVKSVLENYAQNSLNTNVSIANVDTSFANKSADINTIKINNPAGFKSDYALLIDNFNFSLNNDATSDLIIIDTLIFDGIHIILEQVKSNINIDTIIKNLKHTSDTSASKDSSSKRIIIKSFSVKNSNIKINSKFLKEDIKVPDLNIKDFGGTQGIAFDDVGGELIKVLLNNAKKAIKDKGIDIAGEEIKKTLKRKIEEKLGVKTDDLKEIQNTVKDKAKKLLKNFGFE